MTPTPTPDRSDLLGVGGEKARGLAGEVRRERIRSTAAKSWGRFLAEIAIKTAVVFVVFALLFWLLSLWRGY